MNKVTKLGKVTNNALMLSPSDILKAALNDVSEGGALNHTKKVVVLVLDDVESDYDVTWYQAGMKSSESAFLCRVGEMKIEREGMNLFS